MGRVLNFLLILTSCFFASGFCEVLNLSPCTDENDLRGLCEIKEIRITPCKEALEKKPCPLKRGKEYSYEVDFKALEPISNSFNGLAYWASGTGDLPFAGMSSNACESTQCPIEKGTSQTYNVTLKVARILPRGKFNTKWKMWTDDNTLGCCARFGLKVI